jgi:hypothetical protein
MGSIPGDVWVICDLSGKKVRMSETKKTWDGLRVYAPLWYPRHPLLDVRGIPDKMAVSDPRPRPDEIYVCGSGGFLREPFLLEIQGFLGPETDYNCISPPTWDDMT